MHIVLATGIYPPEIGGPATYVRELRRELQLRSAAVTVIAYGVSPDAEEDDVVRISRSGGPLVRWNRYAAALRRYGRDADIVYAFSSVSVGVPLWMARLRHPKTILRLGGDFLWERYTDRGGTKGLKDWYAAGPRFQGVMNGLLKQFQHIVFSTAFEEEIYEKFYSVLPLHSVIENAVPLGMPVLHRAHDPFRLLFLGRFVGFKNLGSLILALEEEPAMHLTLVGDGPLLQPLQNIVHERSLAYRVTFLPAQGGDKKQQVFLDHDLLVLPSLTEISPNVALEARASGMPVLLTQETGLSAALLDGAMLRPLRSPPEIAQALREARDNYPTLAERSAGVLPERSWGKVAEEHLSLFRSFL